MTKQFRVEKCGVETGAVHFDEGRFGSGTQVMNHPCHPSLPGAALASQQNSGTLALGQQRYLVAKILHAGGGPERIQAMARRALHQQCFVDSSQPCLVRHPSSGGGKVLHVDRLAQEIFRAELHGSNRGGNVGLAGEKNDGGVSLTKVLQDLHPVHPGQAEVEDHNFWSEPVKGGQSGFPAELPGYFIPQLLEVVPNAA
jgi:hypothetical protein